jgi:adenosylmethionine-8-amino-7-oxononanoate aminotransferase
LAAAVVDRAIVREVRGRGFLLGVEYVDPRDGTSPLPAGLDVADLVDRTALDHGLLVVSTDDHTVLAPAFTATDAELAQMVERFAGVLGEAEGVVRRALADAT